MTKLTTLIQANKREIARFLKFCVVGTIGAAVDFGVYNLLIKAAHLLPEIAGVIALATAICSNFIWNRYWTYPDSRSKPVLGQFVQFFLINILAVVIRVPIIALTKAPFGQLVERSLLLEAEAAATLGYNISWAIAVAIALFWNFFVNRVWTYSDVD